MAILRHILACILGASLVSVQVVAQEKSVKPGINKPFENPDLKDFLTKFEGESPEIVANAKAIVAACQIKPRMAVADVGGGTGVIGEENILKENYFIRFERVEEDKPAAADFQAVTCEGTYPHHLQGVCTNEKDAIFWCFTTKFVKTDRRGKVVKEVDVANHHGDLCYYKGSVYVALNLGKFNDPKGNADSWVYVYDAGDLSLRAKHKTPEVFHGAGGIAVHDGKFLVVGGLPDDLKENYLYEYDSDCKFVKKHTLASGHTHLGIQTAAFADGHWWFGCYGNPQILLKADASFNNVERFEFDCSLGIVPVGDGKVLVARGGSTKEKGHTGRLVLAVSDNKSGLKVVDK